MFGLSRNEGPEASTIEFRTSRERGFQAPSWASLLDGTDGASPPPQTAGESRSSRTASHFGEARKSRSTRRWSARPAQWTPARGGSSATGTGPATSQSTQVPHLPRAPTRRAGAMPFGGVRPGGRRTLRSPSRRAAPPASSRSRPGSGPVGAGRSNRRAHAPLDRTRSARCPARARAEPAGAADSALRRQRRRRAAARRAPGGAAVGVLSLVAGS